MIPLTPAGEYGRTVSVSVGPRDGGEAKEWKSDTLQSVAPGVPPTLVTGLRIGFEVSRDNASNPSKGLVRLYNLSRESRAWLQADGLQVVLKAGYGTEPRSLFVADVADVWHEKQGTDWITSIEGGDGENAYLNATINYSGAPGVSRRDVFDQLATAMGGVLVYVPEVANTAYRSGVTLVGNAREFMDDLTDEMGLRWSFQDGAIQVLESGGATTEPAFVISAESGLIGRVALRRSDDDVAGVKFKVRLNGLLAPGRQVVIDEADVNGVYVCEVVSHKGDSGYSPEYATDVEATEIEQ